MTDEEKKEFFNNLIDMFDENQFKEAYDKIEKVYAQDTSIGKYIDEDGDNLLHIASLYEDETGAVNIVKDLLIDKYKMNVNAVNKLGNTPLHHAAYHNNTRTARTLHVNGANADAINGEGKTPLDDAIEQKCDEMVKYLSTVTDLTKKNKDGETVIDKTEDSKIKVQLLTTEKEKRDDAVSFYGKIGGGIAAVSAVFGVAAFVPQIRNFLTQKIGKFFGKFAIAGFAITAAASLATLGYAGYNKMKAKEFTAEIDKINNPQASLGQE